MNLRELLKKDFQIDFPISGSTANSQDSPIVIHKHDHHDYASVEHGILRCIGFARGVEWEILERRSVEHDGKYLDQLTLETKRTTETEIITQLESYYFDISECVNVEIASHDDPG